MNRLAEGVRLEEVPPEPGRFWIRFFPKAWPAPAGMWTHLASSGLGPERVEPCPSLPQAFPDGLDDVVYLPPVVPEAVPARNELVGHLQASGTPLIVQHLPGEPCPSMATAVCDLLPALVGDELDGALEQVAAPVVAWPLAPGLSDDLGLFRRVAAGLRRRQVTYLVIVSLELQPEERRYLAEGCREEAYSSLFHGTVPAERPFVQAAHDNGLQPFLPRPLPAAAGREVHNRQASACLALAGELWLRLGRGESRGQAFYRAARWVDSSRYDLRALGREGNLRVLEWLDADSRSLLEEWAQAGSSSLVERLLAEYVGKPLSP